VVRAMSYCGEHLTDGWVPEEWVRTQLPARGGKKVFAEATKPLPPRGNPLFHRAGELCDDCLTALKSAGTAPPTTGFYLHAFLECNRPKAKVLADRARWAKEKEEQRGRGEQGSFVFTGSSRPGMSGPDSAPPRTPGGGEGEAQRTSQGDAIDAGARVGDLAERHNTAVRDVVAILAGARRFVIDPESTPLGVEQAIATYPDRDPIAAARTAVVWVSDPNFRKTSPAGVFLDALARQRVAAAEPERDRAAQDWDEWVAEHMPEFDGNEARIAAMHASIAGSGLRDHHLLTPELVRARMARAARRAS
jgi:hypothetical protein